MNISEYFTLGWQAVKVEFLALTGLTVTVVAAAKTMTRDSGSFISDGVVVGDKVTTTGFADGGNNGTFEVTGLAATVLTLANATGLVNVTDDGGVTVHTGDRVVRTGKTLLGRLRVITSSDDVTPYDDTTALWDAVDSTAELDVAMTPFYVETALRLRCTTAAEAWAFYKVV